MRSAVAVTVGNRHSGTAKEVDCNLSAEKLNDALQTHGLRVEPPWINQPGGEPMLQRLRQVLANEVRWTDDGFVFCFCGHGRTTELLGNDDVPTLYQAIIDAIDAEPKLRSRPKVVVFETLTLTLTLTRRAPTLRRCAPRTCARRSSACSSTRCSPR